MRSSAAELNRPKLVVIHGWGGSFSEAAARIGGCFNFPARWQQGAFAVPRRIGLVVRQVLGASEPDRYTVAVQKLLVSRLMDCSLQSPAATAAAGEEGDAIRIPERRLIEEFAHFGIPIAPGTRAVRAAQLRADAMAELDAVMPCIERLRDELQDKDNGWPSEMRARQIIRERSRESGLQGDLVQLLETLRDMHETGGDMDTVGSAALYTHWLLSSARARERDLKYGVDYHYVFINYHESLKGLAHYGPADLLIADLPIGALPSFEDDVRFLRESDVRVERYEDHHPYTLAQKAMLATLKEQGLLGFFDLSGPVQDKELDQDAQRCGADMVYDNTIRGAAWDCPGARTIQNAAHCEDFVTARTPLGGMMTALIKGGACKIELVQTLVESIADDDAVERLQKREWAQLSDERHEYFEHLKPKLLENAFIMSFRRKTTDTAEAGGDAMGPGSDMPVQKTRTRADTGVVRVLVALAIQTAPNEPRMPIGRIVEYYTQSVPDADYLFYCYGASMLVARRLNQADFTFNLGTLMPLLGNPGDGGHSGAAVCRPETNAAFPDRILGRVPPRVFKSFVRYLQYRLGEAGYEALNMQNRSVPPREQLRQGSRKLLYVALAAALIGLALLLIRPAYRPAGVRESNRTFFPNIAVSEKQQETP